MFNLQGFLVVGALTENAPGEVALFGEISADALTYAVDRGIYTDPDIRGSAVIGFSSFDEADPEITVEPSLDQVSQMLRVTKYLSDQSDNGLVTDDRDALFDMLMAQFGDEITSLTFGDIVQDGNRWMPQWLMWSQIPAAGEAATATYKIWFSDVAFRQQYDRYTIRIVAPIDRIDDFFLDPLVVKRTVEARTMTTTMEKVQQIRKLDPFTLNRSDMFEYNDPEDPTWKVPTNWITLHYGIAGNNIDAIKDAIVKWILANSTHSREEWVKIFPELFTSTEFICTPMWLNYATENKTNQAGVHSPIMSYADAVTLSNLCCKSPGYTPEHIIGYLTSLPVMFKSMNIAVVGGPENRNGTYWLTDYVKDYINTPTGSIDANRMSNSTREWVLLMERLLETAERMTEFSDMPVGINRMNRNGVLYAAASHNQVQYLVVSRLWLEKATGIFPPVPLS